MSREIPNGLGKEAPKDFFNQIFQDAKTLSPEQRAELVALFDGPEFSPPQESVSEHTNENFSDKPQGENPKDDRVEKTPESLEAKKQRLDAKRQSLEARWDAQKKSIAELARMRENFQTKFGEVVEQVKKEFGISEKNKEWVETSLIAKNAIQKKAVSEVVLRMNMEPKNMAELKALQKANAKLLKGNIDLQKDIVLYNRDLKGFSVESGDSTKVGESEDIDYDAWKKTGTKSDVHEEGDYFKNNMIAVDRNEKHLLSMGDIMRVGSKSIEGQSMKLMGLE